MHPSYALQCHPMTAASPKPKRKRPPVLKWKSSNQAKQTAAIAPFAMGVKPQWLTMAQQINKTRVNKSDSKQQLSSPYIPKLINTITPLNDGTEPKANEAKLLFTSSICLFVCLFVHAKTKRGDCGSHTTSVKSVVASTLDTQALSLTKRLA
jgi:hypothetical protein